MRIILEPIGYVRAARREAEDDFWGAVESRIELVDTLDPDALLGLETFSHAEVFYHFPPCGRFLKTVHGLRSASSASPG